MANLANPLSLLREYSIARREIVEKNGQIILGEYSWSKDVRTNFLEYGSGKFGTSKKYYTLETVLFCLKNKSLSDIEYVNEAEAKDVPMVFRADRQELLAYLTGKKRTCSSIDKRGPLAIPARDGKLPPVTKPPSLLEINIFDKKKTVEKPYQFCVKEYMRRRNAPPTSLETEPAKDSRQKKTDIAEPAKRVKCVADVPEPAKSVKFATDVPKPAKSVKCATDEPAKSVKCSTNKPEPAECTTDKPEPAECITDKSEPAQFVTCASGQKLRDGQYLFTKHRETAKRTYWRCDFEVLFRCPARITTTNDQIESKWRSHDHLRSNPPRVVEQPKTDYQTKTNLTNVSDSETTREDTENVNGSGTNAEIIKKSGHDVDRSNAVSSETTKDGSENVTASCDTNSETVMANTEDINRSSTVLSETAKEDAENAVSLPDANEELVKANVQDAKISSVTKCETKVTVENVGSSSDTNTETTKAADRASASSSKSGAERAEEAGSLMSALSKRFDEFASKVANGATDFQDEELSTISTVYSLYHRLLILRKLNNAFDSVVSDLLIARACEYVSEKLESSAEHERSESSGCDLNEVSPKERRTSAEMIAHSSRAGESPAADVCAAAEGAAVEDASNEPEDDDSSTNLSGKVTCVCTICDQPIDIPPDRDVRFIMETHLHALHPHRDALESKSNGDEDDGRSNDEPLADPRILLDGTRVEDFEVKFDRENALKYVIHSNGIVANHKGLVCVLCGHYMPEDRLLALHLTSKSHRRKIGDYVRRSDEVKKERAVAVDARTFAIRDGRLRCVECGCDLGDPHSFWTHANQRHAHELKLDGSAVVIGGVEFCALCDCRIRANRQTRMHAATKEHYVEYLKRTTVVQLKSVRFCTLCRVKLFTESQFRSHVNHESHISRLALIDATLRDVKFDKSKLIS